MSAKRFIPYGVSNFIQSTGSEGVRSDRVGVDGGGGDEVVGYFDGMYL